MFNPLFNPALGSVNGGFIGNIAGIQSNPFSTPTGFGEETFISQGKKPSGKLGNIPPESTTVPYGGFVPFGIGGERVPYAEQERGLFRPRVNEAPGFATPGVVLSGGRRGQNPGVPIKGKGINSLGINTQEEQYYRSPSRMLDGGMGNLQLQLRKLGVPGF